MMWRVPTISLLVLFCVLLGATFAFAHPCSGPACLHDSHGTQSCGPVPGCQGAECPQDPNCLMRRNTQQQSLPNAEVPAASSKAEQRLDAPPEKPISEKDSALSWSTPSLFDLGFPTILLSWQVLLCLGALGLSFAPVSLRRVLGNVALFVVGGVSALTVRPFFEAGPPIFFLGAFLLLVTGLNLLSPTSIKRAASLLTTFLVGAGCGLLIWPYWEATPTVLGTIATSLVVTLPLIGLNALVANFLYGDIFKIVSRILGSWLAAIGFMLAGLALR